MDGTLVVEFGIPRRKAPATRYGRHYRKVYERLAAVSPDEWLPVRSRTRREARAMYDVVRKAQIVAAARLDGRTVWLQKKENRK